MKIKSLMMFFAAATALALCFGQAAHAAVSPTVLSLSPSTVTTNPGVAQSFNSAYYDGDGDISAVYLSVGSWAGGISMIYNKSDGKLYLLNDSASGYAGSCTPGRTGTLSNSQGTLNCARTQVRSFGRTVSVIWNITPKSGFASVTPRNIYLLAADRSGRYTGWVDKGDWTIFSNVAPTATSVTPQTLQSFSGIAQGLSAVYSDGNGYSDMSNAYITVGTGALFVAFYSKSDGKVYLLNDSATGSVGSCSPGSSGTLSNTHGTLNCATTTVSGSGNSLTVNWSITPKSIFASTTPKNVYLYVADSSGANTGWVDKGDWTIEVDYSSPFGYHPADISKFGYSNNGYSDAQSLGVKWTRIRYAFWFLIQPNLNSNVYDFSIYDDEYLGVPDNMSILAIISHISEDPANYAEYSTPGSYMPSDTAKYLAFVKATVERYDGDGVDDAPGLSNPIKYWQVENEPTMTVAPDFGDLQRITYTAIKEACADCTVLIGGAAAINSYDFNQNFKPFIAGMGGPYLDVMDFHWFGDATGDYRSVKELYDTVRATLDSYGLQSAPIWINESGSYSGQPTTSQALSYQTERQQAMDYLKRYVYYLAIGVRRSFSAFGLMEGFKNDNGYFDHTGLIYDGQGSDDLGLGVKKLGYYSYRKMTDMLEGSDWSNVETIRESGNVYIYRFTDSASGAKTYVAWWDYFDEPSYTNGATKQVSISWPSGAAPTVTEALPRYDTGAQVVNYSGAFDTYTAPLSGGSITISLGDSPVFIR